MGGHQDATLDLSPALLWSIVSGAQGILSLWSSDTQESCLSQKNRKTFLTLFTIKLAADVWKEGKTWPGALKPFYVFHVSKRSVFDLQQRFLLGRSFLGGNYWCWTEYDFVLSQCLPEWEFPKEGPILPHPPTAALLSQSHCFHTPDFWVSSSSEIVAQALLT